MEIQNNNRVTREYCCSLCRSPGHNMLTCDNECLRDFEIDCASKCQTIEPNNFKIWLINTYEDNIILLKAFTSKLRGITSVHNTITSYSDIITTYIYETYKYEYVSSIPDNTDPFVGNGTYSSNINDSMTSVIDDVSNPNLDYDDYNSSFEYNMISFFNDFTSVPIRENRTYENLSDNSISNEYNNAELLYIESIQNAHSLIRLFNIENIVEKLQENMKKPNECCVCMNSHNKSDFITFGCNHEFCKECTKNTLRVNPICPLCRANITKVVSRTDEVHYELDKLAI